MTSASYPVSSAPASSHHSFLVHLQSLTGFAGELRTQVEGLAKPAGTVAGMDDDPPSFGPFAEAATLSAWSRDAVAHMTGLIDDVRSAMQFADEVTRTVATGYREADDDVATGIGGHAVGTVIGVTGAPISAAAGAVGGVTAGVGNTLSGAVEGLGHTVDGVTGTVGHGVGETLGGTGTILGALTGHAQPPGAGPADIPGGLR